MDQHIPESAKVKYTRMVCLFLAEGLRTRQVTLKRAVEITEKILQNINLMDTEQDYLSLVKELSADFEELSALETKMQFKRAAGERRQLETLAREYAINILPTDPGQALKILQEAAQDGMTLAQLESRNPQFSAYLKNHA